MPDHRDKPASAMAHGPAKCSDIERVRGMSAKRMSARWMRRNCLLHVTGSGSPLAWQSMSKDARIPRASLYRARARASR